MHNDAAIKRHADLVDRMATALGHDLEEEAFRGRVSLDEIAEAVLRCTGCTRPDECATWLARQQAPVAAPPGYCRNRALFEELDRGRG